MTSNKKISQRFPSTGATAAEQTAANASKRGGGGHVWQIDKLVYQLVENNVGFAKESFKENLKFNSEVLTNVIYDNISKLLEDKFNDDELVDWLADELADNGGVLSGGESESAEEPAPVDASGLDALKTQLDAVVKLIRANKPTFLQNMKVIDDGVTSLKQQIGNQLRQISVSASILQRRNDTITQLVGKLNTNQKRYDDHVESTNNLKVAFGDKITEFQEQMDKSIQKQDKLGKIGDFSKNIKGTLKKISGQNKVNDGGLRVSGKNLAQLKKNPGLLKGIFGKPLKPKARLMPKKPSAIARIKTKMQVLGRSIKNKVSKSFIGKTYRAVKAAVKLVGKVVKGVYKATKAVVKGFIKASKVAGKIGLAIGKFGVEVGKSIYRAGKRVVQAGIKLWKSLPGKAKILAPILAPLAIFHSDWAPAQFVAKLGWKGVKFVAKKIWKGIKRLVFKTVSFFKGLFRMAGKFVNKIANWVAKLGSGIKDKAYRFLVKPIAGLLVSVFGFVGSVVMAPVKFMQNLIPSIFDRTHEAMHNVKEGALSAWRSTLSFVKKILTSPITLFLLVGGMFFFFGKWLWDKFSGWIGEVKGGILGVITTIAEKVWGFLTTVWNIISTVGKALFKVVEWVTNPDGWVVKAVTWVIKAFLWVKGMIKKLMKAAGKSSIDILCMFLAGDMIGVVLWTIAGLCVKFWQWLKNTPVIKLVFGVIKFLLGVHKMILQIPWRIVQSIGGALWKLVKGDWGDIPEAFAAPWREWWSGVKNLFTTLGGDAAYAMAERDYMKENPIEVNAEKATRARIAVRSLKMKGTPEDNLKYLERLQEVQGNAAAGSILKRMEKMNDYYQHNSQQVEEYDEFLSKMWEAGKGSDELGARILKMLVESEELSQKLLSAFFYFNPQTGELTQLRPSSYIEQFLDNIRTMLSEDGVDYQEAFKTFIEAFDQLNKERSHIINNQGDVIADFAERIGKFDQSNKDVSKNGAVELHEYVRTLNNGDLFKKVNAQQSFFQIQHGDAKSQDVESVTGSNLGTNKLLEVKDLGSSAGGQSPRDFKAKPYQKPQEQVSETVLVPPGMNPPPYKNPVMEASIESLREKWFDHQEKRRQLMNSGMSES